MRGLPVAKYFLNNCSSYSVHGDVRLRGAEEKASSTIREELSFISAPASCHCSCMGCRL